MRAPSTRTAPRAWGPGTLVGGGKYRLEHALGTGGMGEVWAATNRATRAQVAVKVRRPDTARAVSAVRFQHEARLAASLTHRGIVRVFDLVEDDDGPVLVMELLRGETLARLLRERGPLGNRETIAIVLPLLSALGHAHDRGIVHRDVKPANVFLAREPDGQIVPKLLDFGIAKLPESGFQTLDGSVLGTPEYMAPERIRGLPEIDGRSDLFSVGVLIYELLTGLCPFAAPSAAASLAAVLEQVVDPDPRIDPRVWLEVQRALAKHAYERHPSAREMADALRSAAGATEADLEACLREALVVRAAPESASAGLLPARAVATLARTVHIRGKGVLFGLRAWPSLVVLAGALIALLATFFARHAKESSPREAASAKYAPAVSEAAAPSPLTGDAVAVDFEPTAPTLASSASASPVPRHPPRAPAHRPRPVATTPGF